MDKQKIPVIFCGHGSPMMALEDSSITREFAELGQRIIEQFGRPKAILMISAHWYTRGSFVQSAEQPEQIYDMYGFPEALYQLKYPVRGDRNLTETVLTSLGDAVSIHDDWGIDHGSWSVLVHMFPKADIPVVQLSVNAELNAKESFELGQKLAHLREEGYLILGSGNIVHNLRAVEWDMEGGTEATARFDAQIVEAISKQELDVVLNYHELDEAAYAVPTPDHFLPLCYCLGAATGDKPSFFNQVLQLGSLSMTSVAFGLKQE